MLGIERVSAYHKMWEVKLRPKWLLARCRATRSEAGKLRRGYRVDGWGRHWAARRCWHRERITRARLYSSWLLKMRLDPIRSHPPISRQNGDDCVADLWLTPLTRNFARRRGGEGSQTKRQLAVRRISRSRPRRAPLLII